MEHLHHVKSIADLKPVVDEIINHLDGFPIVLLKGNLGAGKTTLSQLIGKTVGISEELTSPTYTLVNEYSLGDSKKLYHFDLYRLKSTEELEAIGFTEYIDSGNIYLIEWPELAEPFLMGMPVQEVMIRTNGTEREIVIHYHTQIV